MTGFVHVRQTRTNDSARHYLLGINFGTKLVLSQNQQFMRFVKLRYRRHGRQINATTKFTSVKNHKKSKTTNFNNNGSASKPGVDNEYQFNANRLGIYRPKNNGPKPAGKPGVSCPTSNQPYVLNVRWLNNSSETRPIVQWKPIIADLSRKPAKLNTSSPAAAKTDLAQTNYSKSYLSHPEAVSSTRPANASSGISLAQVPLRKRAATLV